MRLAKQLPDDLFEKICKARTYRAASQMLRQLLFSMTDIELHSNVRSEWGRVGV